MAIVHFSFDKKADGFQPHYGDQTPVSWPEGAYSPLESSYSTPERRDTHGNMVLWETYQGACLWEREKNGYDDSDFFMSVWDEESQQVKEILFASTRGWTYPSYASKVDATPEVRAKADAWLKKRDAESKAIARKEQAKELIIIRKKIQSASEELNFPAYRLSSLIKKNPQNREGLLKLLTASLRSPFRISLRERLVSWLRESEPTYTSPFSYKQWQCI